MKKRTWRAIPTRFPMSRTKTQSEERKKARPVVKKTWRTRTGTANTKPSGEEPMRTGAATSRIAVVTAICSSAERTTLTGRISRGKTTFETRFPWLTMIDVERWSTEERKLNGMKLAKRTSVYPAKPPVVGPPQRILNTNEKTKA